MKHHLAPLLVAALLLVAVATVASVAFWCTPDKPHQSPIHLGAGAASTAARLVTPLPMLETQRRLWARTPPPPLPSPADCAQGCTMLAREKCPEAALSDAGLSCLARCTSGGLPAACLANAGTVAAIRACGVPCEVP